MMLSFVAIFACSVSVGFLLLAEATGNLRLKWLSKTAASLAFVGLAIDQGALGSDYGRWVLGALVFCLMGDVLLIPASTPTFLAGMGAFATGHALFTFAFLGSGTASWLTLVIALGAVALLMLPVLRWLWPHLGALAWPVTGYCAIIAAMVASSLFAAPNFPELSIMIAVGAVSFAVSDIAVARDQFVKPALINRLWGLPLYYGAQMMLASSV